MPTCQPQCVALKVPAEPVSHQITVAGLQSIEDAGVTFVCLGGGVPTRPRGGLGVSRFETREQLDREIQNVIAAERGKIAVKVLARRLEIMAAGNLAIENNLELAQRSGSHVLQIAAT